MHLIWEDVSFEGGESIIKKILTSCCCVCCPTRVKRDRCILNKLNGKLEIGTMTALMGPSGAGKSTLLNCLTQGKNYTGYSSGHLLVESQQSIVASFISQHPIDHLLLSLTVEESLRYSSELKNSNNEAHEDIISSLIGQLGLGEVRKRIVGKCSGGQQTRLAIGLELTSNPKPTYLFLDEPTSGLDSLAGLELVTLLSSMVHNKPMSIIATIHQPSYEMLLKFNQVYFLSKSGCFIYGGQPTMNLTDYITNHHYYEIQSRTQPPGWKKENENPADIMIKIASAISREDGNKNYTKVYDEERPAPEPEPIVLICHKMIETYKKTFGAQQDRSTLKEIQEDGLCRNSAEFSFKNLWVLLKRTGRSTILGQPKFVLIRLALHVFVAAILASLYSRDLGLEDGCYTLDPRVDLKNCSCLHSEKELRDETVQIQNVKFQFFSLLFLMFAALMPTVLSYPAEIKIFLNEHRNGWYTTTTYYIAKSIIEIPIQLLYPFLYTCFLYWYTQQIGFGEWYNGLFFVHVTWRYTIFMCITILCCFIGQGLGFLIGIICVNHYNITIMLSSSILLFLFLFSGFFVKTIEMPSAVSWITYFSFIKFGFESLLLLIYGYDRCGLIPRPGSSIPEIQTKPSILFIFDLHEDELVGNVVWLTAHLFIIRILAFLALKNLADPKFLKPQRIGQDIANFFLTLCAKIKPCCSRLSVIASCAVKICFVIFSIQVVISVVMIIVQGLQ